MRTVLVYDGGEEYEPSILVMEFKNKEELIYFINNTQIHRIISSYEIHKKLEFEPYEKVVSYKIKTT